MKMVLVSTEINNRIGTTDRGLYLSSLLQINTASIKAANKPMAVVISSRVF
ncbi:MAG: hypothetical protein QHH06_00090 [Clostridiales bacterium]|nr:hypothetical protein [Eubacteriales bacterium]MDH7564869.1 hypothetical protein [Clostridiales bacterium]